MKTVIFFSLALTLWGQSDYIYVSSFGVVGNGVTDDTLAFQRAINAAESTGKPLYCNYTGNAIKVSRSGYMSLPWNGTSNPYSLLITSSVRIDGDCLITKDVSDSSTANVFWVDGTNNVRIDGLQFNGTGAMTTRQPPACLGGVNCLYVGAAILFNNCDYCSATRIHTVNMRGNTLGFTSYNISMKDSFSSIPIGTGAGGHFVCYSCIGATIDNVTVYGASSDGDVYFLGGPHARFASLPAIGNVISNSHAYNYAFGDLTRTINPTVNGGGQGFMCDGGSAAVRIEHNYAYGYFFPFDAKASCHDVVIADNIAEKCKVGMSTRFGEDMFQVYNVTITGNKVWTEGGTGDTTTTFFGGLTDHVCFFIQDSYFVNFTNNTCGPIGSAGFYSPGSYTDNYIGLFAVMDVMGESSNEVGGIVFADNTIRMNDTLPGGVGVQGTLAAIWIIGTNGQVFRSLDIHGNHIRAVGRATQELIHIENANDVNFIGNSVEHYQGTGVFPIIQLTNVYNFNGSSNTFDQFVEVLKATTSSHLLFSNNSMSDSLVSSVGSLIAPVIKSDNSTFWTVVGNTKAQNPSFSSDGPFFVTNDGDTCPSATNTLTITNNNIQATVETTRLTRICGTNNYSNLFTNINWNNINGIPLYNRTTFFPNPSNFVQVGIRDGTSQLPNCQIVFSNSSGIDESTICTGSGNPSFTGNAGSIYLDNSSGSAVGGGFWIWTSSGWTQVLVTTNGVISFNGRKGIVVPTNGDYTLSQIGSRSGVMSFSDLNGTLSSSQMPPGGLNGTFTCSAGTHVNVITAVNGQITGASCSP